MNTERLTPESKEEAVRKSLNEATLFQKLLLGFAYLPIVCANGRGIAIH